MTGVPLVAATLPGVITPVPLLNTPVRVVLCPAVMVATLAVKLVIEAGGVVGVELEEPPPQPIRFARVKLSATTHVAKIRSRFMIIPVTENLVDFSRRQSYGLLHSLVNRFFELSGKKPRQCPVLRGRSTAFQGSYRNGRNRSREPLRRVPCNSRPPASPTHGA